MASVGPPSASAATVCATRSATVGTPRILTPPPCGLGISTARTGGGKYVPDDIRFQILYRLFLRSDSKSSRDCLSTPGAPLFALTRLYASHTSCFGITNGLPSGPDLSTRLLPGTTPPFLMRTNPDEPAPSLHPHYTSFTTTTSQSANTCRTGTQRLQFQLSSALPLAPATPPGAVSAPAFPRSVRKPQTGLAPPSCRAPPGQ